MSRADNHLPGASVQQHSLRFGPFALTMLVGGALRQHPLHALIRINIDEPRMVSGVLAAAPYEHTNVKGVRKNLQKACEAHTLAGYAAQFSPQTPKRDLPGSIAHVDVLYDAGVYGVPRDCFVLHRISVRGTSRILAAFSPPSLAISDLFSQLFNVFVIKQREDTPRTPIERAWCFAEYLRLLYEVDLYVEIFDERFDECELAQVAS
jgi:hypothetical protein